MSKAKEIIDALNQPIIKLIDTVSGAIGKAWEPRYNRKMADAKAYEIKQIAQAMKESDGIEIRYNNGEVTANNEEINQLVLRTQNRITFQEINKQMNIEAVADLAYDLLETETECSADSVSQDWIIRFINSVEDVSDDDMQLLWAKVLAGEIKQPKTFSLRTIEVLRNLSKEEALLFQRICKYVIDLRGTQFIPNNQDLLDEYDVSYRDILNLDECGLVNSDSLLQCSRTIEKVETIAHNKSMILVADPTQSQNKTFSSQIYPLTTIGREVLKLIDDVSVDEFFIAYAKRLKQESSISLSAYRIINRVENNFKVIPVDLLKE